MIKLEIPSIIKRLSKYAISRRIQESEARIQNNLINNGSIFSILTRQTDQIILYEAF